MGEHEGEITISSNGPSSLPTKLALILLIVPICYLVLSGIDVGQLTSELDCDNPEKDPRCNSKDPYDGQICCVIIPLLLSFVLFLSNISPHTEEEK